MAKIVVELDLRILNYKLQFLAMNFGTKRLSHFATPGRHYKQIILYYDMIWYMYIS
jgi:hypothetical protein